MHNWLFLWTQSSRGSAEAQLHCWGLLWGSLVGFCLFRACASRCQECWLVRCCPQASIVRHSQLFQFGQILSIYFIGNLNIWWCERSSASIFLTTFPTLFSVCHKTTPTVSVCFLLALSLKWALRKAGLCWAEPQSFVTTKNSAFCGVIKAVFSIRQLSSQHE